MMLSDIPSSPEFYMGIVFGGLQGLEFIFVDIFTSIRCIFLNLIRGYI